jgi:hypothetical protein
MRRGLALPGGQLFHGTHKALNRIRRLVKRRGFGVGQPDLDDLFNAASAEFYGNAHKKIADPVFPSR